MGSQNNEANSEILPVRLSLPLKYSVLMRSTIAAPLIIKLAANCVVNRYATRVTICAAVNDVMGVEYSDGMRLYSVRCAPYCKSAPSIANAAPRGETFQGIGKRFFCFGGASTNSLKIKDGLVRKYFNAN